MLRLLSGLILITLVAVSAVPPAAGEEGGKVSYVIESIPKGFHLYSCDDCGVIGRQPHVQMEDSYIWTFATSDTDADIKSRSAVFSYKQLNFVYDDLDPKLSYALVLTYASDHVYKRVQSLWADGIELHGPIALPQAKAMKVMVSVPKSVTEDGKMKLEIKIHGEVNATASIVELWASGPARNGVRLERIAAYDQGLIGRVVNVAYEGAAGADVVLKKPGSSTPIARTKTGPDGRYTFAKAVLDGKPRGDLEIVATLDNSTASMTVPPAEQDFDPIRYRPIPEKVAGVRSNLLSLDGNWQISTSVAARSDDMDKPPTGANWGDIKVPGQWLQQGYDVPQDKEALMAREFTVPDELKGQRLFLRFDSIHAATTYWLNGRKLGYSEILFCPVDWEITDLVKFGQTNRLDLLMKVESISERLSYSSGYAFHSLGGIDRSVHIYAVPKLSIKHLRVVGDLDSKYEDGIINLEVDLENATGQAADGVAVDLKLYGPNGKETRHTVQRIDFGRLSPGTATKSVSSTVTKPPQWNAEKPMLHKLVVELSQNGKVVETVERSIGFRKVEIKGRQLYVNGHRVKLAGACRHEVDPLTGRADTMRHAVEDVKLTKEANLNYIRTSHYPPPKELVDAADKLGVYVEVEAPFCWVAPTEELTELREVLTPTSAMVDYFYSHPSVIVWSIANESNFNEFFAISNSMVKSLDPSRPTTFNHPMSNAEKENCDIANRHYPGQPYDNVMPDDPRPLYLGEYMYPLCHEQTDMRIDPGLRELWGHGHANPTSEWAKKTSEKHWGPAAKAGFWDSIVASQQVIGGAIWALLDEPFYFPDGKHCGYAWVHGFWGLYDAWRRPKPEAELSKYIFSPVWFLSRSVEVQPGQKSITLPVENRYSFTDFSELKFEWEFRGKKGTLRASAAPGTRTDLTIPVPDGATQGDSIRLRIWDPSGRMVNDLLVALGSRKPEPIPQPTAGAPKVTEQADSFLVEGSGFALVIDKKTGNLNPADPRHKSPLRSLPTVHATRFDFGDLGGPKAIPYALLPDEKTRKVESVAVREAGAGAEITVKESYEGFAGQMVWLIDKNGTGSVSYDYTTSLDDLKAREVGLRMQLDAGCDTLRWRRWSEWGVFPEDSICRTEGTATLWRKGAKGADPEGVRPKWPWGQDQTELGTADFRGVKFCIYDASLVNAKGSGVDVRANADAHVRCNLADDVVVMHVLSDCPLGPVVIEKGGHIKGSFAINLKP